MLDKKNTVWSVYLVECSDGTLYTGISNNVIKRVKTHNSGKGAKYTRSRLPVVLLVTWECGTRSDASKEEYRVKKLTRTQKFDLIKEKNMNNKEEDGCIDYSKVSENEEVIRLIKKRNEIEKQISEIDKFALVNYELQKLAL